MELKDTIPLMTSRDYRERFKAEYYQLKIRIEKLSAMLEKWDAGELNFTPTCPKDLLEKQCNHMDDYRRILEQRARLEGIVLEE